MKLQRVAGCGSVILKIINIVLLCLTKLSEKVKNGNYGRLAVNNV